LPSPLARRSPRQEQPALGLGTGHMTRGCADHPCLTDGQQGETLDPNFDWDGGTVRGTPILGQKLAFTAPQ
jgi:hypothetical protein